ncbi:MAG: hypothetical protein KGJ06_10065, partial [Pseudomonadota bacterium]|nr:hypothetical protein [Pseudomonadota bacterium]
LEEAFEPERNIAYAAGFLHDLFQEQGSWKKAAADYHSKTPQLGSVYADQVYDNWFQIIGKLRAARLQVSGSAVASAVSTAPHVVHASSAPQVVKAKTAMAEARNSKVVVYKDEREVQASHSGATMDNGVIVVRPEIKVADASPTPRAAAPAAAPDPLASALVAAVREQTARAQAADVVAVHAEGSQSAAPAASERRVGPNFIFND